MRKLIHTLPHTRDPFQNLFGRLFRDALPELYEGDEAAQATLPRTNISETATAYELAFDLPGVNEADIDVQLHEKTLTVTAERKDVRETNDKAEAGDGNGAAKTRKWHRVEHRYGSYSRTISLPQDAASDGIEAVYEAGVLTVTVPKQPEAQPARIAVRRA